MTDKKRLWMRLDNAAKLYPADKNQKLEQRIQIVGDAYGTNRSRVSAIRT